MPAVEAGSVPRSRFNGRMSVAVAQPVVQVVAPAGFGKTTAVAQWLTGRGDSQRTAAWLSLDESDDEPDRFWGRVWSAVAAWDLDVSGGAVRDGAGDAGIDAATLIAALNGLTTQHLLVLDDCQVIVDPAILRGLRQLTDHQSGGFRLIVIGRSDPTFIPPRLRLAGDVAEIGARELLFDDGEMRRLVDHDSPSVRLSPEALAAQTGCWPIAVRYLSALDGMSPGSVSDQRAAHSGRSVDPRAVMPLRRSRLTEYFVAEVLDQLPPRTSRFLLLTSGLDALSAPLCDAVTGGSDGAALLDQLREHGLFIASSSAGPAPDRADPDGVEWFRHPDLVLGLLRRLLNHRYSGQVQELHRRAAQWYYSHDYIDDAIQHAITGRDWQAVRAVMLNAVMSIGTRRPPGLVQKWLGLLPPEQLDTAFFHTVQAFVSGQCGLLDEARSALKHAARLSGTRSVPADLPELDGLRECLGAAIGRLEGDLDEVVRRSAAVTTELERAGVTDTPAAQMASATAVVSLLGVRTWYGDRGEVARLLDETDELIPTYLVRMRANRAALRALWLSSGGNLVESAAEAAAALDLAATAGTEDMFQSNPAWLARAVVSWHRADSVDPLQELILLRDKAFGHGDRCLAVSTAALLCRAFACSGKLDEAFDALHQVRSWWPQWSMPSPLRAVLAELEARLCLAVHDRGAAAAQVRLLEGLDQRLPEVRLATMSAQARLHIADDSPAAATELFESAADVATRAGLRVSVVEMLVGVAVTQRSAGTLELAESALDRALAVAAPDSIIRPFLEEAAGVRPILMHMAVSPVGFAELHVRERLLKLLDVPIPAHNATGAAAPGREILTEQQRKVLRLLSGPLTNQEIASALSVSPNTLKSHIRQLYQKLHVTTRSGAVSRAKELRLL